MGKPKYSEKQELEAEIRNKLTMPLTVLNSFMTGKKVSLKSVEIAIREIERVFELMKKTRYIYPHQFLSKLRY